MPAGNISTYSGWAGGAFVKGQAGWQDVVKPWKKASNLWEKNQHQKVT